MTRFKCVFCGRLNRLVDMPLTFRQRRVLKAIAQLERDLGMPASTQLIADAVNVSRATAYNELIHLEHTREVCRPNGLRSGWSIEEVQEQISIPA
jgi:SOS-response transcriptional repressor LexA